VHSSGNSRHTHTGEKYKMGTAKCMLKDITFSRCGGSRLLCWDNASGDGNVNIYYVVLGGVVLDIFVSASSLLEIWALFGVVFLALENEKFSAVCFFVFVCFEKEWGDNVHQVCVSFLENQNYNRGFLGASCLKS